MAGVFCMAKNCDYLWKTNTAEVTKPLAEEVLKSIKSLRTMVDGLEKSVQTRKPTDSIPQAWVENVMNDVMRIQVNVARINGAVLVRGTE
jgi:hypothetical protein